MSTQDDLNHHLLAPILAGIERGESFCARTFLDRVAADIETGHPVAEPYRSALVAMLRKVRDSKTPFGTVLLRRRRGQKAADARMTARDLAYFVSLIRNGGEKVEVAQRLVADGYRVRLDAVAQAWKTHGKEFPKISR